MRTVILSILLTTVHSVFGQNILDSIQLHDFPVKQGTIYKYEYSSSPTQHCASSLSIVSVVTSTDSVYHFEEGEVASVFPIDHNYAIVISNSKGQTITYSNLRKVMLKKGDKVRRGTCVGTTGESDNEMIDLNQVDVLVLHKVKALPYGQAVQYMRLLSDPKKAYQLACAVKTVKATKYSKYKNSKRSKAKGRKTTKKTTRTRYA
jgi:hypothetical protein